MNGLLRHLLPLAVVCKAFRQSEPSTARRRWHTATRKQASMVRARVRPTMPPHPRRQTHGGDVSARVHTANRQETTPAAQSAVLEFPGGARGTEGHVDTFARHPSGTRSERRAAYAGARKKVFSSCHDLRNKLWFAFVCVDDYVAGPRPWFMASTLRDRIRAFYEATHDWPGEHDLKPASLKTPRIRFNARVEACTRSG